MKNPCLECRYKDECQPIEGHEPSCTEFGKYIGYQKCLKELAEKCGPNPCGQCHEWAGLPTSCNRYLNRDIACPDYRGWLGQQECYAKELLEAESKKGEAAREIVGWLKEQDKTNAPYTGQPWASRMVEDYCREKGWLEEEA